MSHKNIRFPPSYLSTYLLKLGKSYKLRNSTPSTYHQVTSKSNLYCLIFLTYVVLLGTKMQWKIAREKKERVTDQVCTFPLFWYKIFEKNLVIISYHNFLELFPTSKVCNCIRKTWQLHWNSFNAASVLVLLCACPYFLCHSLAIIPCFYHIAL